MTNAKRMSRYLGYSAGDFEYFSPRRRKSRDTVQQWGEIWHLAKMIVPNFTPIGAEVGRNCQLIAAPKTENFMHFRNIM